MKSSHLGLAVLFILVAALSPGQAQSPATDLNSDQMNFEVQLHLIVAANEHNGSGRIPQTLDAVVKQLKQSLPYANYDLAATFVNRVRDGGTLELKGVVSSDFFVGSPGTNQAPQTFYEFTLQQVKSIPSTTNPPSININRFRFGLRLPVVTSMARVEGNNSSPVINYEPTGISTEITLREGSPTVVGTMTTSRPGQALVLVILIKRVS